MKNGMAMVGFASCIAMGVSLFQIDTLTKNTQEKTIQILGKNTDVTVMQGLRSAQGKIVAGSGNNPKDLTAIFPGKGVIYTIIFSPDSTYQIYTQSTVAIRSDQELEEPTLKLDGDTTGFTATFNDAENNAVTFALSEGGYEIFRSQPLLSSQVPNQD